MAARSENDEGYPADKARQGEIVLRTRVQRLIFIAGLAGIVVLALLVAVAGP